MTVAYIGFGSNLGNRQENIRRAVKRLQAQEGVQVKQIAPVIETEPLGPKDQGAYLNTVCKVETEAPAHLLLLLCQQIEEELGRDRSQEAQRWGPRIIDLDLLLFGAAVIDEPRLKVPHPEMHARRFVLEPLAAIAPDIEHPVLGQTIKDLLAALPDAS